MKFYFNDLSESDRDIIVNLCKENSIFFNIKSESIGGFFANTKIYTVIVHTDYEHKLFLDFLYKKELEKKRELQQQIKDLEICLLDEQQHLVNASFDSSNFKVVIDGKEFIPCNGMTFKIEPQKKDIWSVLRDKFNKERGI
jgi:hypothetical protein